MWHEDIYIYIYVYIHVYAQSNRVGGKGGEGQKEAEELSLHQKDSEFLRGLAARSGREMPKVIKLAPHKAVPTTLSFRADIKSLRGHAFPRGGLLKKSCSRTSLKQRREYPRLFRPFAEVRGAARTRFFTVYYGVVEFFIFRISNYLYYSTILSQTRMNKLI